MDTINLNIISIDACAPIPIENQRAELQIFLPHYIPTTFVEPNEYQYIPLRWNISSRSALSIKAVQISAHLGISAELVAHSESEAAITIKNNSRNRFSIYGGMHICNAIFVKMAMRHATTFVFYEQRD